MPGTVTLTKTECPKGAKETRTVEVRVPENQVDRYVGIGWMRPKAPTPTDTATKTPVSILSTASRKRT